MRICLTGQLGYIGQHLIPKLKERFVNADIIGLDIKEGNDICSCTLPDADLVIHLAAQPGVIQSMADPVEAVRTNTYGTVRLWEKYKNIRFIFASTGGAIQEEIVSPYGLSKYYAEGFIKMLFDNAVILRFANVYGKEGSRSVIDKFIDQDIEIYGNGSQTRTFVYINDLIDGIIQSIGWERGTYYFGSDQNYSILELAKATGKPIKFGSWVKGELKHSSLKNTTPGWMPKKNVIEYIKEAMKKI